MVVVGWEVGRGERGRIEQVGLRVHANRNVNCTDRVQREGSESLRRKRAPQDEMFLEDLAGTCFEIVDYCDDKSRLLREFSPSLSSVSLQTLLGPSKAVRRGRWRRVRVGSGSSKVLLAADGWEMHQRFPLRSQQTTVDRL